MQQNNKNEDLEKKIRDFAKHTIRDWRICGFNSIVNRGEFNEFMDWFFQKTSGNGLYNNEIDGAAFATLMYRLSTDISVGCFFFGGVRKEEMESISKKRIETTAEVVAEFFAEREYAASFWYLLTHPLEMLDEIHKNKIILKSKFPEYNERRMDYKGGFEIKLTEMYKKYLETPT